MSARDRGGSDSRAADIPSDEEGLPRVRMDRAISAPSGDGNELRDKLRHHAAVEAAVAVDVGPEGALGLERGAESPKGGVKFPTRPKVSLRKRAQLYFVRCTHEGCDAPRELRDGVIRAAHLTTREAKIMWTERPRRVLLVKKWRSVDARRAAVELGVWLCDMKGAEVIMDCGEAEYEEVAVEAADARARLQKRFGEDAGRRRDVSSASGLARPPTCVEREGLILATLADPQGTPRRSEDGEWFDGVDLVVCVGGDGTVLHTSYLFSRPMPPILSVAFGSLGFMTPFSLAEARRLCEVVFDGAAADDGKTESDESGSASQTARSVSRAIASDPLRARVHRPVPLDIAIRMRLKAYVLRRGVKDGSVGTRVVLNEILVDRGPSPFLVQLEASVDGEPLTTAMADGIIVATPTGSTAYSLSAGGSILMPTVPAICFTPICPHSLSFRPVLFPDSSTIKLLVPTDARSPAYASFDGRDSTKLDPGDALVISASEYPMPLLSKWSTQRDWTHSINTKLHWNRREQQRPFDDDDAPTSVIDVADALFDDEEEEQDESSELQDSAAGAHKDEELY